MPPMAVKRGDSPFEIDRQRNTLRFVRYLAASPREVFDAWTQPEQLRQWWDANGDELSICEVDLRVGGNFRFAAPSHLDRPFAGTYTRIEPPHALEFSAMGADGSVEIQSRPEGSLLTVEISCSSEEHLENFVRFGVDRGTAQTLDNLVAFLAEA